MEFEGWPSISRMTKDAIYTEKIDGTNAAVVIEPYTTDLDTTNQVDTVSIDGELYTLWAQSRKRFITPGNDNAGFALWVYENAVNLVKVLGVGRHFGEWWGSGVQNGYGMPKGSPKRFSLFNVKRWSDVLDWNKGHELVPQLYMVPVLDISTFSTERARKLVEELRVYGSWASPGFMKPEGVVVFHTAAGVSFKTFLENDDLHKFQQN